MKRMVKRSRCAKSAKDEHVIHTWFWIEISQCSSLIGKWELAQGNFSGWKTTTYGPKTGPRKQLPQSTGPDICITLSIYLKICRLDKNLQSYLLVGLIQWMWSKSPVWSTELQADTQHRSYHLRKLNIPNVLDRLTDSSWDKFIMGFGSFDIVRRHNRWCSYTRKLHSTTIMF